MKTLKMSPISPNDPLYPESAAAPLCMGEHYIPHEPVLLRELLEWVPPQVGVLVDCTLGGGGHAEALLSHCPSGQLFGCDRDPQAVQAATSRLQAHQERVLIKHLPFSELHHYVLLGTVDFLLADLGVSSHQLDEAGRGFSFTRDGPLDMRMDAAGKSPSAADLVNSSAPEQLREWFFRLGEERFSNRIVAALVQARAKEPVTTTAQLAGIVAQAVPARFHRKGFHPATRIFQALRMAVNDELGNLATLLDRLIDLLAPGGRGAIISFHSLEDRMVKQQFRAWEKPCTCPPRLPLCVCGRVALGRALHRGTIIPSPEEISTNPRSRSARLRVFEKHPESRQGENP